MRTEDDIIHVSVNLTGTIELDRQRMIEDDPNWEQISARWDLSKPIQLQAAIGLYLSHYITRERFLRDMPTTNGPGTLFMSGFSVQFHQEQDKETKDGSHGNNASDGRKSPGDAELSSKD